MRIISTIKPTVIGTYLRLRLFVLIASLFSASFATAQVKFTTVINSREIGRGDYVQVEFIVENAKQIENLVPPSFPNFHVVEGPIQSSGMSIINGNTSQYKGVSFVLQPTKTGRFTISGATADIDGKPMHSNSVTIEVNATGPPASPPAALQPVWPDEPEDAAREYLLKPGENIADKIRKNLFVKVQASKTTCFIGEPIVVTYKLYSRLRSESRVTKRPSLNGFSVYDMTDPNRDVASVEMLNGKQFAVHIIRKAQLIPLQPGIVSLDPAEVENKVYFIKQTNAPKRRRSLLDEFFGQSADEGEETTQNITLQSQALAITVKPLPEEHKPADFNGAVGHFIIESTLEKKKIAANDAGTLKVVIKGDGNLPMVNAPQVSWPDSIEAFDPTTKENIDKTTAPLAGSKTFEYVFTPQKKGEYAVAPIGFSFFDPVSASYKSVQCPPINLEVSAATKQKRSPVQRGEEMAGGVKLFFQQHLEWFFALLILAGLAVYLWRQNTRLRKAEQHAKSSAEPIKTTTVQQTPTIIPEPADPLLKARRMLANGDYQNFYRELNHAVWEGIRETLNLPGSELNKSNIRRQLKTKGWDDAALASLESTLNTCEMNLYTPDHDEQNMQQLLGDAELILKYLREGV